MAGTIAAIALAAGAMAGAFPALRLGRRTRGGILLVLGTLVLAAPLLIPEGRRPRRLIGSILAITLAVKLYDLLVGARRGRRPNVREFLAFLPNVFGLVERRLDDLPRPGRARDLRTFARGAVGVVAGGTAFAATFAIDWGHRPFVVEHAAKVLTSFAVLVPLGVAGSAGWRLIGGRGLDLMRNPFAARTPADFWRRYNRPVNHFFLEDLFKPFGGVRSPVKATLLVFAASAVVHEYVFAVPIGRVEGVQSAFFLLQGIAVLATARLRPRGRWAAVAIAGTLTFNVLTSMLFFKSLGEVVPFYARRGTA
ncbi:MAG TPA: MBOAT family O-acyltransferase [Isosphaeraceae bacterium]|jgi:hypothetical protein|nr:MBOAT family O-acyltransferase [Isosphaeraceae bacterium]